MTTVTEHPACATTILSAEKKTENLIIDAYVHERDLVELICESEKLLAISG